MCRDQQQQQQFPSTSPSWISKMVGKCIWRIVVFTACVCVGVACSFCLALALAFGFWGQFSSVSSHHFVWIVFTVAVEFRGMQIDFGEAGQLFKPASKLRALKSCTHTHTRKERERDRDRYLVRMRVFQFSRTFHCSNSSSLKISQNFARLVGQWAWQSVGELYCVCGTVLTMTKVPPRSVGSPLKQGDGREQTLIMGCLLHFLNCNWNLVWHWLWLWLAL